MRAEENNTSQLYEYWTYWSIIVIGALLMYVDVHEAAHFPLRKSDCLGCVVLLCLVICMLASFFLLHLHLCIYMQCMCVSVTSLYPFSREEYSWGRKYSLEMACISLCGGDRGEQDDGFLTLLDIHRV